MRGPAAERLLRLNRPRRFATEADYIIVPFPIQEEWERVQFHAEKAAFNGISRIYSDPVERMAKIPEQSLTGVLTDRAAWFYATGSTERWDRIRCWRNRPENERKGDRGEDLPGVDVKGSCWKKRKPLIEHHLWVRPAEYSWQREYWCGFVDYDDRLVYLLGWSLGERLREEYDEQDKKRFTLDAAELYPLPQNGEDHFGWMTHASFDWWKASHDYRR